MSEVSYLHGSGGLLLELVSLLNLIIQYSNQYNLEKMRGHTLECVDRVRKETSAWKLWVEERALELVENMSDRPYSAPDVLRCIHVGLLYVQQKPEDRPNMSSVVLMLGSENSLPDLKQPGFFTETNMPAMDSSTGNHESSSINDLTISEPEGR
ncbi:hypothetical protein DKX38_025849 [Salix brachista]|uniref:S-locus receptor kinase C-terminal domain-containing protein n=1 Tax=Salix brachista TaxID=2182728 RepID=A0A5N5JVD9_9ROSI|nr:hypothetical protein DKX38_025849 [Salix brachista]